MTYGPAQKTDKTGASLSSARLTGRPYSKRFYEILKARRKLPCRRLSRDELVFPLWRLDMFFWGGADFFLVLERRTWELDRKKKACGFLGTILPDHDHFLIFGASYSWFLSGLVGWIGSWVLFLIMIILVILGWFYPHQRWCFDGFVVLGLWWFNDQVFLRSIHMWWMASISCCYVTGCFRNLKVECENSDLNPTLRLGKAGGCCPNGFNLSNMLL